MDRPMGQVRSLDNQLNEAGYLRLSTTERLVKHMGNRLENRLENQPGSRSRQGIGRRLGNFPPLRRSLLWLYDRIFRLYYSG